MSRKKWQIKNAKNVVDYLEKHPSRHDQSEWFTLDGVSAIDVSVKEVEKNLCKTTMCVAGCVMWQNYGPFGLSLFANGGSNAEIIAITEAARLLGVSTGEAHVLFYDTNDEEALYVLKRIAKGKKNIFKGTIYDAQYN